MTTKHPDPRCNFCNRGAKEVTTLMAAPSDEYFICDDCVDFCALALEAHRNKDKSE